MLHALAASKDQSIKCVIIQLVYFHRFLSVSTSLRKGSTEAEADQKEARAWLSKFDVKSIPKQACEITFSRSSGPGGQNVNK